MDKRLIEALVGEENRERYLTSPWFKVGIDALATLLPRLVEGLVLAADKKQGEFEEQVREAERSFDRSRFALNAALRLDEIEAARLAADVRSLKGG